MKSNIDPRALLRTITKPNTILAHENAAPGPTNRISGLLVENISVQLVEGSQAVLKLPDGRYRVRCKGQHCGIVNRNRRRYDAPVWARHLLPDAAFLRKIRARGVVGQLEHPDDGKSSMGLGAIVITDVTLDPATGEVMIEFETMSTPAGKIAAAYIADGVRFGISSRGNGSVIVDADGVSVVQDDFDPVTFDLVIDESTPGAEVTAERVRMAARTETIEWGIPTYDRKTMLLAEARVRATLKPLTEGMLARYKFASAAQAKAFVEAAQARYGWTPVVETVDPMYASSLLPEGRGMDTLAKEFGGVCGIGELKPSHSAAQTEGQAPWAARLLEAIKRREVSVPNNVSEDYVVLDGSPYTGVVLELEFGNRAEAEKASAALESAGFYCDLPEGDAALSVYTGFEDVEAACAHIARVLNMNDIAPKAEESRVVKAQEGKAVETRPFPGATIIEFYGQTFPVSNEDEFELWDEEGQPTKWGATKERKGDDGEKEKDEGISADALINRLGTDASPSFVSAVSMLANGAMNGNRAWFDGLDPATQDQLASALTAAHINSNMPIAGPAYRLAKALRIEAKGDKAGEKEKDEAKGDDEKDDKDESLMHALQAVIEKHKGKGGKTGTASMPEAKDDDEKEKDEGKKGKGEADPKDAKKDENAPIRHVLARKTGGQPNGRLEVFRVGEAVVEVRTYNEAGALVGFTGPQEAYRRLVIERAKGDEKDKKDEKKGKGAEPEKKDEAKGKGDAAKDSMPSKPQAKPGAAAMGKGKGKATESRSLANIIPKLLEATKLFGKSQNESDEDPADICADGLKNFDAHIIKPIRDALDHVTAEGHRQAQAQASLQRHTGATTAPDHLAGVIPTMNRLREVVSHLTDTVRDVCKRGGAHIREGVEPATSNTPAAAPAAPSVPVAAVCEAHDTKIRHLQGEVARVESENGELRGLFEAMSAHNDALDVKLAVYESLRAHPELLKAESRLLACDSREAVLAESGALLGILLETRAAAPAPTKPAPVAAIKAPSPVSTGATSAPAGGGGTTTTVQSSKTQGAPSGPLVAENVSTAGLTGALKESRSSDEMSRVAAYRARKRQS